jgi:hypothetical protein
VVQTGYIKTVNSEKVEYLQTYFNPSQPKQRQREKESEEIVVRETVFSFRINNIYEFFPYLKRVTRPHHYKDELIRQTTARNFVRSTLRIVLL